MSGDVESTPEVSSFQAASFRSIRAHVAVAKSVLNDIEQACPGEPEERRDQQSRNMMLEELLQIATAQREVREIQERR